MSAALNLVNYIYDSSPNKQKCSVNKLLNQKLPNTVKQGHQT